MGRIIKSNKKCIPGFFCIENMTLFLLFVIIIILGYLYHYQILQPSMVSITHPTATTLLPLAPVTPLALAPISTRNDPLQSEYAPPLKTESYGLPINIKTRGVESNYSQFGILTRSASPETMILPLMRRRSSSGRDKYQYYTMTNSAGNINTKLPVSVGGRSCTSDMGCNEIFDNDNVYVEGYNDTFSATIYENALYSYIPLL